MPDHSGKGITAVVDETSALAFLCARLNVEQVAPASLNTAEVFTLARMSRLMNELGNPHPPHLAYRTIHIAGSKGKGSVCEMVASALVACGYSVGLYTSPHLEHLSERIRVGGVNITPAQFTSAISAVAAAVQRVPELTGATYFECLTAAAFWHFQQSGVEVAVIETGLGGRDDATNVVAPLVAAITAIQLEHTQILGDTLGRIAMAKAGIMKSGAVAITIAQNPEAAAVIRTESRTVGCPLWVVGADIGYSHRYQEGADGVQQMTVSIQHGSATFADCPVPFPGEHQALNCGLALSIIAELSNQGWHLPAASVAAGIAQTPRRGRMELVRTQSPRVVIDGAHTPDSLSALLRTLAGAMRYESLMVVFGAAADKDLSGMMKALAGGADKVYFTRAKESRRAANPDELLAAYEAVRGGMAQAMPDIRISLREAMRVAQRNDLVLATGSNAVAGEARTILHGV